MRVMSPRKDQSLDRFLEKKNLLNDMHSRHHLSCPFQGIHFCIVTGPFCVSEARHQESFSVSKSLLFFSIGQQKLLSKSLSLFLIFLGAKHVQLFFSCLRFLLLLYAANKNPDRLAPRGEI